MCGLVGILGKEKPVAADVLSAMSRTLKHRGPDDNGEFIDGSVGLAHRRLSIIDVDHGHQPMMDETNRYVIVYNGELYNYLELRQELVQSGFRLRTFSDTEVLLYLYIKEGESCLGKLIGMFAFAVHDRETRETFIARDRFGIKPLYYAPVANGLIFASEIKALLQYPGMVARPKMGAIYEYLTFQFCFDDRTLFEGIRKLEPASYMMVKDGCVTEKTTYWGMNFTVNPRDTDEYFVENLEFLLQDSIRLQLRSDVPIGAYLSGGLDSSAVTCMAAQLLGGPISTFHGSFHGSKLYNETEYAHAVSNHAQTRNFDVYPTAKDFADTLGKLIYHMDEPAAGPGLFPQYFVSKLAAQHVKVVLGGQGGDEIFGGYARYLIAYLEQCIKSAIFEKQEEGRFVVTLDTMIPNMSLLKEYVPLIKKFWSKGVFGPMDQRYFELTNRMDGSLYSRSLLDGYRREKVMGTFTSLFNQPVTASYFNKMTHFDMKTLLPALLQVEDRMSMAVSLESRVPFLDHRIVELVASMPPTLKFANGKTKHVLRRAVGTKVPKMVLDRKDKMGFPVPLAEWCNEGVVRDFVSDVMLSKKCRERELFDTAQIEAAIERKQCFGRDLWGALCLELWFGRFIDGST